MSHQRPLILALAVGTILLVGCTEDTSGLKQKIAALEKKVQKQEQELREFADKFALPRDFSADIQRIEDQQEKVTQAIKTKVDPINSKLEEFRDWAQEAQKERVEAAKKLKAVEDSLAEMEKRLAADRHQTAELNKAIAPFKKNLAEYPKTIGNLTSQLTQLRKEFLDNNTKIIEAVKKTLPKVKDAAVAEIKDRLTPLEKGLNDLKASVEADRKTISAVQQVSPESGKAVESVNRRVRELEEVLASQKAFLLEVGTKVHELELILRRSSGQDEYTAPKFSNR